MNLKNLKFPKVNTLCHQHHLSQKSLRMCEMEGKPT
jgi:hypothetical protein